MPAEPAGRNEWHSLRGPTRRSPDGARDDCGLLTLRGRACRERQRSRKRRATEGQGWGDSPCQALPTGKVANALLPLPASGRLTVSPRYWIVSVAFLDNDVW